MGSNLNWEKITKFPSLTITSGTMEVAKWIALVSMTVDHSNRFFFAGSIPSLYNAGRIAMPLFAFIFAYNLARPDALTRGLYKKIFMRLIFFGVLATPGYIAMLHLPSIWPLNIMFMLAVATAVLYCCDSGKVANLPLALLIFTLGGIFVEYNWVGVFFCVTSWFYCKKPTILHLLACLTAYLLLDNINGNHWALASLPIIALATQVDIKVPRILYFFYIYYPLHLGILYGLSKLL